MSDGTPFGRYRLVDLVGRGGMGEVWRAYDTATERVVAIKVLPAHLAQDSDYAARFRREAHAAAGLNNPHIVPIHDYGEIDGRLFVTMRLIDGNDLAARVARAPPTTASGRQLRSAMARAWPRWPTSAAERSAGSPRSTSSAAAACRSAKVSGSAP